MTPGYARIQGKPGIFPPERKAPNSSVPAPAFSREVPVDVAPAERGYGDPGGIRESSRRRLSGPAFPGPVEKSRRPPVKGGTRHDDTL